MARKKRMNRAAVLQAAPTQTVRVVLACTVLHDRGHRDATLAWRCRTPVLLHSRHAHVVIVHRLVAPSCSRASSWLGYVLTKESRTISEQSPQNSCLKGQICHADMTQLLSGTVVIVRNTSRVPANIDTGWGQPPYSALREGSTSAVPWNMLRECREQCEHCTDRVLMNMSPVNTHTRLLTNVSQKRLFLLCFAPVQNTCLQPASTIFRFHKVRGLRLAAWAKAFLSVDGFYTQGPERCASSFVQSKAAPSFWFARNWLTWSHHNRVLYRRNIIFCARGVMCLHRTGAYWFPDAKVQ